jgi:hypothetical protein
MKILLDECVTKRLKRQLFHYQNMKNLLPIVLILLIVACNEQPTQKNEETKTPISQVARAVDARAVDATAEEAEEQIDTTDLPIFQELKNVLITRTYHADEIWKGAKKQKWYGLFQNKNSFYIAETKLKVQHVEDIMDKKGKKTGWEINTENKDTSFILLSKINLIEGKVEDAVVNIKQLDCIKNTPPEFYENIRQPGFSLSPSEQIDFTFKRIKYNLLATGTKRGSNYKLILKANKNGNQTEQMIVAGPRFDYPPTIMWIGDIDKDHKIDLIINVSSRENTSRIAVFLSSKASKNELLKYFGECLTVGC